MLVCRANLSEASKGTPGDSKCVTEIFGGGGKNKEVRGDKIYVFVSRENKRIEPQSSNLSINCEAYLCVNCSETHLQAFLIPKFSRGVIAPDAR